LSRLFSCGKLAVIASKAKQSRFLVSKRPDCFVAPLLAMTKCPHAQPSRYWGIMSSTEGCHCERSEAISISCTKQPDCFVAPLLAMTVRAFAALIVYAELLLLCAILDSGFPGASTALICPLPEGCHEFIEGRVRCVSFQHGIFVQNLSLVLLAQAVDEDPMMLRLGRGFPQNRESAFRQACLEFVFRSYHAVFRVTQDRPGQQNHRDEQESSHAIPLFRWLKSRRELLVRSVFPMLHTGFG